MSAFSFYWDQNSGWGEYTEVDDGFLQIDARLLERFALRVRAR